MIDMDLSNNEINSTINLTFKNESDRAIARSRIIDGMTYAQILNNYFSTSEYSDRKKERMIKMKIMPIIKKAINAINSQQSWGEME